MKIYKQTQKDKDFFTKTIQQTKALGFNKTQPETGRDDATTSQP
tara:strand:+ start:4046 stop:4177 length:132 start_codon:yes stop_codon:yes gene_type:complete